MPEVHLTAEFIVLLITLIPLPITLLALIRPVGRLAFFCAGLVFMFAVGELVTPSGPDNPMLVLPGIGLVLAVDAVLAELIYRLVRLVRSRRLAKRE